MDAVPAAVLRLLGCLIKFKSLPRLLTADGIVPPVASLTDSQRIKLLKRIASLRGKDASAYMTEPPTRDDFSGDEEPLAWEADGSDGFR